MEVTVIPVEENSQTPERLGPLLGFLALILLLAALASFLLGAMVVFWILLVLGVGSLVAFVVLSAQDVKRFFVSRQAHYGSNVAISLIGVVGIAVIINTVVSQRLDKTADWTADKLYTLSDQTKKILHGLDREVKVLAFFSNNSGNPRLQQQRELAEDVLSRYQHETEVLTVQFVDPVADPQTFDVYDIQFDGTVVFESGEKREHVTAINEQACTSAILKVARDEIKGIYFLIGHEERSIDDFDVRSGYNEAREALEKQNYMVETLTLTTESEVPADCSALVVPAPKTALIAHEIDAIARYLDKNGKLLLMFEPSIASVEDPSQRLVDLMSRWGVAVGNDEVLVFHPSFYYEFVGPTAPVIFDFELHPLTRYVQPVIFQITRSVTPKEVERTDLSVKSLAKTIESIGVSWGETGRQEDGTFEPDPAYTEGEDTPPPVSLAVVVEIRGRDSTSEADRPADEPMETRTRIVVFGDSDFASNAFFANSGGGDLFLNAVNWLTLEEDLIAIRPVDPSQRSLRRMTASEARFVQMASIFLIPLIVFVVGVLVWWSRSQPVP